MTDDTAVEALAGSLGLFWTGEQDESGAVQLRGYLDRDAGWARLQALEERDVPLLLDQPAPEQIIGRVPKTSVLLLELPRPSTSRVLAGYRASTTTFRARTLVADVPLDRVLSNRVLALQADFLGITHWAGLQPIVSEADHDEAGRATAYRLALAAHEPLIVYISGSRTLELSVDWNVSGSPDAPTVYAPVTVTSRSKRPRPVWDLLQALLRVQELISLAHSAFVPASGGRCIPEISVGTDDDEFADPEDHLRRRPMWNGALMIPSPGVKTKANAIPAFGIESLGGVGGLRRWIALAESHDRATTVLSDPYRIGGTSAGNTLRAAANGIEYWVAAHRRAARWTQLPKGTKNASPAKALARHAGRNFRQWVGDPDRWAEEFWDAYNALKHDPAFVIDQPLLHELAQSGRYLLAAALLDRVGRSRIPSRHLLNSGNIYQLGFAIRQRYGFS
jgi:hypothetical protein